MSAPSSLPQQKATLWTQSDAHVYAVIDASQVPGLPEVLLKADILGWDCLHRGVRRDADLDRPAGGSLLEPGQRRLDPGAHLGIRGQDGHGR